MAVTIFHVRLPCANSLSEEMIVQSSFLHFHSFLNRKYAKDKAWGFRRTLIKCGASKCSDMNNCKIIKADYTLHRRGRLHCPHMLSLNLPMTPVSRGYVRPPAPVQLIGFHQLRRNKKRHNRSQRCIKPQASSSTLYSRMKPI